MQALAVYDRPIKPVAVDYLLQPYLPGVDSAQVRTPEKSWKTIEDLNPQLAEFDLCCAGEDYDTAAGVLLEIDLDYLLLWGHFQLVAELHERLRDKLSDPYLKQRSVGNLGSAYYSMGQYQKAINCYDQALEIADEIGHTQLQNWARYGLALCGLSLCEDDRNHISDPINAYTAARMINRNDGIVDRVLRLFDEMAKADSKCLLTEVRSLLLP